VHRHRRLQRNCSRSSVRPFVRAVTLQSGGAPGVDAASGSVLALFALRSAGAAAGTDRSRCVCTQAHQARYSVAIGRTRRARLSDRDLQTLQRKKLDFSTVKAEDRRTYSLVGPVSLLNCGCVACTNVQEVDHWSRVQVVADIDAGEELLVSYCSSCSDRTCDSKHFLCPACKEHHCC
jgi:hypothetical protein